MGNEGVFCASMPPDPPPPLRGPLQAGFGLSGGHADSALWGSVQRVVAQSSAGGFEKCERSVAVKTAG